MKRLKKIVNKTRDTLIYEGLFVGLAVLSILLLIYEVITRPPLETVQLYERIDFWIAWFFMADFIAGHVAAEHKKTYWRENWIILLSSIPINEQLFRSFRILRLFRIARLIKSIHQATHSPKRQKRKKRRRRPS